MKESIENRRYLPVELPFYDRLNWDKDLIISCLDVFRIRLKYWFKKFPETAKYDLISLENPHGSAYPAIGIQCNGKQDFDSLPDFIELYDFLQAKMTNEMIEEIIKEAKLIDSITWVELEKIKVYSEPVRYKNRET